MDEVKRITEFATSIFNMYGLPKIGFLRDYDEESDEVVDIPLFVGDVADIATIDRLAIHFGMTDEEIVNCDEQAARRFWNKYPFFYLFDKYLDTWAWSSRFMGKEPTLLERFNWAIWGGKEGFPVTRRYYFSEVKTRLIEKLKEIDAVVPGTFHKDAEILDLSIRTEVFFSFPECKTMMSSFLDMLNRLKELFMKAVSSDLSEEEQKEINFLASWFDARDVMLPSSLITYDNICLFRNIYREENLKDFYSYVRIRRISYDGFLYNTTDFVPWRCQEFFEDQEIVQEFVDNFPFAKKSMREFANLVANFCCVFTWSDANPIRYSPDEERELSEFNQSIGEEDIPLEERAKEPTRIYVEKTPEETAGWDQYIRNLNQAVSPPAQGGLRLPPQTFDLSAASSMIRKKKRLDAKHDWR